MEITEYDGTLVAKITLENLDALHAAELKQEIPKLDVSKRKVRLDLSPVQFIDSSGVGVLLSFFKRARQQGAESFVLVAPQPAVLSVIELLRLHRVFTIET